MILYTEPEELTTFSTKWEMEVKVKSRKFRDKILRREAS